MSVQVGFGEPSEPLPISLTGAFQSLAHGQGGSRALCAKVAPMLGLISENVVHLRPFLHQEGGSIEKLPAASTALGTLSQIYRGKLKEREFLYIPYNGIGQGLSPPNSSAAAMLYFKEQGVRQVLSIGFAGAINSLLSVGDIVIPHDVIDFTKHRFRSVHEMQAPGTRLHYRCAELFCPNLRQAYLLAARALPQRSNLIAKGVFVTSDGPRFETPAEIRAFAGMGGDFAGLTVAPEVFLARELDMCFANLSIISNIAEGLESQTSSWQEMRALTEQWRRDTLAQIYVGTMLQITDQECACPTYWHRHPTLVKADDDLLG